MTSTIPTPLDMNMCPACGDPIDFCPGHGPIGDPARWAVLNAHDQGVHTACHPDGCDLYGTTEPGGHTEAAIRLWLDLRHPEVGSSVRQVVLTAVTVAARYGMMRRPTDVPTIVANRSFVAGMGAAVNLLTDQAWTANDLLAVMDEARIANNQ